MAKTQASPDKTLMWVRTMFPIAIVIVTLICGYVKLSIDVGNKVDKSEFDALKTSVKQVSEKQKTISAQIGDIDDKLDKLSRDLVTLTDTIDRQLNALLSYTSQHTSDRWSKTDDLSFMKDFAYKNQLIMPEHIKTIPDDTLAEKPSL